jgi:hypothetical protein
MWLVSKILKSFSGFGKTAYEVILLKLGPKIINLGVIGNLFYLTFGRVAIHTVKYTQN